MAAGNSTTGRKSSSFQKKKRSKHSSEVKKRRRRRSRSRTRKSDKSKKLRRRDVSLSSWEDDSVSASSSDSEFEYRHRRARSRTRGNLKGSGRKRGRSYGSDSESPHRRKRKGSKQNAEFKSNKKTRKKKRGKGSSQRDVSVNSASSDSWSCSTCREVNSSRESESKRSRGRSEVRSHKVKRNSGKTNKEKGRYRSRTVSSCSGCSKQSSYQSEEELPSVNYSRRLRSVVAVGSRYDEAEERFQSKDEEKADIIQAYDDCPSCRSNDSYDGGRKECSQQTLVITEKKRLVDDGKFRESYTTDCIQSKDTALANCGQNDSAADAIRSTNEGLKGEVSSGIDHPEGDLELILRQKALENLRKFRGELINKRVPGNQKFENDNAVKQPSAAKAETEADKEVGRRVVGTKRIECMNMENVSKPTMNERSATSLQNGGQNPESSGNRFESKAKRDVDHSVMNAGNFSPDRIVGGKSMKGNMNNIRNIDNKSMLNTSASTKECHGDNSKLKQFHPLHDSLDPKSSETKHIVDRIVPVPKSGNALSSTANKTHESAASEASCLNPASGEHGSNVPGDAEQFEQKTMSVMRGGELVQVSYKVYIPKKAPALARRQLQR